MIASIKLFETETVTKKGFPIKVELFYSNKKRRRKTIGHSLPQFWNALKQEPFKEHPSYFDLLPVVLEYHSKIAKINYGNYTFDEAYSILFGDVKIKPKTDPIDIGFLSFLDTFIQKKETKGESIKKFTELKSVLNAYTGNKDFPINDLTYEWLDDFSMQKLQTGCGQGGLMTYLRAMRTVYKEAQRRTSLKVKADNPFLGIIKTTVTKQMVELSPDQINELLNFKPDPSTTDDSAYKMKRNIAVWHFQFLIGGCDYVDIALLKWSDIKDKRIHFKRHKNRNMQNGGVTVNNFLTKTAREVIETYGNKKTDRIFSFIPDPSTGDVYHNFRGNINRSLSLICKQANVPRVTTKSTRYIFRTYAGEKLIHDLIIMKLQGHTPEGVTYRYQGSISPKVQDKAHKKIVKVLN
ncbi:phage integrase SAM-like domain-containing protein [Gelidibacter japonicus]|uniref:phage integrase SAM-like domain-containing protein n=1 Tax=Gelidibacter japonicus TaxID=1962232 RepID=UPI002AFF0E95|nr:phage integrase SAM-like domain-containing protein [Gelidibacter japonicus]